MTERCHVCNGDPCCCWEYADDCVPPGYWEGLGKAFDAAPRLQEHPEDSEGPEPLL